MLFEIPSERGKKFGAQSGRSKGELRALSFN